MPTFTLHASVCICYVLIQAFSFLAQNFLRILLLFEGGN